MQRDTDVYTPGSSAKACAMLGEGWRLPTNDEWQNVANVYGGIREDSVENRKRAYQQLIWRGSSSVNAILGGGRNANGQYRRVGDHGFYWTATENHSQFVSYADFGKNSKAVYH